MTVADFILVIVGFVIALLFFMLAALGAKAIAEMRSKPRDTNYCDDKCKGCNCYRRFGG